MPRLPTHLLKREPPRLYGLRRLKNSVERYEADAYPYLHFFVR